MCKLLCNPPSSSLDAVSNLRNALFVVTDTCCIVCIVALPTLLVVCFSPHLQWTFHDDRWGLWVISRPDPVLYVVHSGWTFVKLVEQLLLLLHLCTSIVIDFTVSYVLTQSEITNNVSRKPSTDWRCPLTWPSPLNQQANLKAISLLSVSIREQWNDNVNNDWQSGF